jgi:Ca-activated chloride channel homolog
MMANFSINLKFLTLILILMGAFSHSFAAVRSAEDYLHASGAKYIQGRLQEASVDVEEGLRHYPNDSKLNALATQLKAMKDQKKQDQGGQGSQGDPDPNKKEDKKDSTSQDPKKKGEEDKKKQEEENRAQQGKEEPAKKDEKDSTGQAASPVKPGEMSKEEAERLLNSYQNDEKQEHEQMQRRQKGPIEVEKDW